MLTVILNGRYAFLMRCWFLLIFHLLAWGYAREVVAAEFYSWTDRSGTVVITDDPKQVPPADQRRDLMTHHFPALPASLPNNEQGHSQSEPSEESSKSVLNHASGDDDALPDILLDQPPEANQQAYLWVPLQTPYIWGSQTFTGFWSHRRVTSPKKAFRAYLRQHQLVQPDQTRTPSRTPSISPGTQTGGAFRDTVYEQVRREREAIQQRGGFLYGSDAAPHSSSGTHSSPSGSPPSNGSGAAPARR